MAFGETPLISDFSGPAENPLSDGGRWATYGRDPLQRGGTGSIHGTVEFAVNGMYYVVSPLTFTGDTIEVWACTPAAGLGAAIETHRIAFWLGTPDSFNGYLSAYGGGISENYFVRRYDGGALTFTGLSETGGTTPEKLGLRITPTVVEQWAYYGSAWNLIVSHADTTHRGSPWFAALETEEQGGVAEVGFSCFGGGVINRTQIYRYVSN